MFENTYLVTDKLVTFSEEEVSAAEALLGTTFPAGYREYVTTLGKGEYCGYVNVYWPHMIARDHAGLKPPLEEFCHMWNGVALGLSPERLALAVPFANSVDGDWVVFEAQTPDVVYVLPRSEDMIYKVGSGLDAALTWLYEPEGNRRFRYFDSGIDQKYVSVPRRLDLSYEDFRDWLLGLHRHDHVEETIEPNEASGGMAYALTSGGKIQIAQPGEKKHFIAFFKCFNGYVLCYTDSFGRLNLEATHDPSSDDGTAAEIAAYLQSKAA